MTRKMRYSKERVGGCEVVGVVIVVTLRVFTYKACTEINEDKMYRH